MYFFYFLLGAVIFWGARGFKRHEWNEEYSSLSQTKIILGIQAMLIPIHHMAQKTCAPWHDPKYIVHGLDVFIPVGHLLVSVFLFCSGLGLYKSLKNKKDYLKGFIGRRIVPLIIAFYLSEFIYVIVRLLMHEKMSPLKLLWYLSGTNMANMNCWYIIAIIFFYFFFYLAFRFCKKEGIAIFWMFFACVAYAVLGSFVGHPTEGLLRGEWWFNSIILFPLGLVFAKYEEKITAFFKKAYPVLLPVAIIGTFGLHILSEYVQDVWGYYGEYWHDPLLIPHRLGCCAVQWILCTFYTASWFLISLKIRLGNRLLALLGSVTLELYLMHGMFVEIFGYDFLEKVPSLHYIRNVPLYILVVFACSIPLTYIYHVVWKALVKLLPYNRASKKSAS